ncbi:AtpZ/AtpI family protein [Evansella sp. AB-rgal1]|uniref:AtpZ/AtpI family protein n=1 Tax=Evansella sp. AB-rgal1 TaxID=3242696 RepID=UPI00359E3B13
MSQPPKIPQIAKMVGLMSTISSYFVGSILLGVFGGSWLDNKCNTNGLFLVLGAIVGMGAAITGIYFAVRKFMGEES